MQQGGCLPKTCCSQPCPLILQDANLKPASLAAPPFVVRRTARREGPLTVRITLHLHEVRCWVGPSLACGKI